MQALLTLVLHEDWACFGERWALAQSHPALWQAFSQSGECREFRFYLGSLDIEVKLIYLTVALRCDVVLAVALTDQLYLVGHGAICGIDLEQDSQIEYECPQWSTETKVGLFRGPLTLRVPSYYNLVPADPSFAARIRVQGRARLWRSCAYDYNRWRLQSQTREEFKTVLRDLVTKK